ncbi:hypothetical protein ENUP19_0134G0014 [Entamoeba nuttalli]|uniref:Uncharacterized protein n=1 Tax=Entamoeba nuttalli TaxID=412467 RepID=A0ABQ0DJX5_9EUKA
MLFYTFSSIGTFERRIINEKDGDDKILGISGEHIVQCNKENKIIDVMDDFVQIFIRNTRNNEIEVKTAFSQYLIDVSIDESFVKFKLYKSGTNIDIQLRITSLF